jgi:hypothetical protein
LIKTRFMSVSPDEIDGRTQNKDSVAWRTRTSSEWKIVGLIEPSGWDHDDRWK